MRLDRVTVQESEPNLRLLSALYVIRLYPQYLESIGNVPRVRLLDTSYLTDARDFLENVSHNT